MLQRRNDAHRSLALALVAFAAIAAASAPREVRAATVPAAIEGTDLAALTKDAAPVRVDPRDGSRLTVVVFLSARCPCSQSHEPGLAELAREYAGQARFVGIHSNADEPVTESAAHFKQASLPFPVIQDQGSRLANDFGAFKTPHAFVLGKKGEVLFEGGVDDSHDATKAGKAYLKLALEALRAGRMPEITLARSLGCQIRR